MSKHPKNQNVSAGTIEEVKAETFTLKEAAVELGLSDVYVRRALMTGKLVSTKEPVSPESKTMRHIITREALNAWRSNTGTMRIHRADGRARFQMYATKEELEAVKTMLADTNNGALIQKPKTYSKKIKATAAVAPVETA